MHKHEVFNKNTSLGLSRLGYLGKNYGCIKAFTGGSHYDGFGPVCGVFCGRV